VASRRRSAPRRSRSRSRLRLPRITLPDLNPEVTRSIVGVILLLLGAVTLVALILPGQGRLTDWWIGEIGPWLGSLRWLLPLLLLGAGWYVEWGPGTRASSGWGITVLGLLISYLSLLGAVQITGLWSGGRLGRFLEGLLVLPITRPGAFLLLVAVVALGVMLAFNLPLRDLVRPGTRLARWLGTTVSASMLREERAGSARSETDREPDGRPVRTPTRILRNEEIIVKKLASFDIPAQIVGRNAGPVVTQYEVQPAAHIKVSRIEALSDDLAMALAARSLRIEAPIPGKSAVGIEIPNKEFNVVTLRGILESVDLASGATSRLTFALGRDVAGRAQAVDLAKMPHLLIAGATGSGKSVMVNAVITSLLCNATPDDVRMILMDLKRVELAAYNGLPHLLVPVIIEPERAKAALKWAVNEMEGRYRRFAGATARNIRGYNETRADPADRMPYIVIVIDELADLMMREGKNVEDPIVRLAQKARATGIHMVLATQRPSVNVVTGLIKANFPSRIAFAMASQIDSRTILDTPGAEDLIGRGDMLYQPSDAPRPMRHQGVFVSDAEIGRITGHWIDQIDDPHYDMSIIANEEDSKGHVDELADSEADRLLPDAVNVVREYDRASASLLQRRLKVGYARAARIIDQLQERGYIGAFDGSNARVVLRRDEAGTESDDGLNGDR